MTLGQRRVFADLKDLCPLFEQMLTSNETLATGSVGKARRKVKNLGNSSEHDCVDHNKLWKTLKEMGVPDHLTCLLRNLYAGQEATVRAGTWNNGLLSNRKRSTPRLYIVTLLI